MILYLKFASAQMGAPTVLAVVLASGVGALSPPSPKRRALDPWRTPVNGHSSPGTSGTFYQTVLWLHISLAPAVVLASSAVVGSPNSPLAWAAWCSVAPLNSILGLGLAVFRARDRDLFNPRAWDGSFSRSTWLLTVSVGLRVCVLSQQPFLAPGKLAPTLLLYVACTLGAIAGSALGEVGRVLLGILPWCLPGLDHHAGTAAALCALGIAAGYGERGYWIPMCALALAGARVEISLANLFTLAAGTACLAANLFPSAPLTGLPRAIRGALMHLLAMVALCGASASAALEGGRVRVARVGRAPGAWSCTSVGWLHMRQRLPQILQTLLYDGTRAACTFLAATILDRPPPVRILHPLRLWDVVLASPLSLCWESATNTIPYAGTEPAWGAMECAALGPASVRLRGGPLVALTGAGYKARLSALHAQCGMFPLAIAAHALCHRGLAVLAAEATWHLGPSEDQPLGWLLATLGARALVTSQASISSGVFLPPGGPSLLDLPFQGVNGSQNSLILDANTRAAASIHAHLFGAPPPAGWPPCGPYSKAFLTSREVCRRAAVRMTKCATCDERLMLDAWAARVGAHPGVPALSPPELLGHHLWTAAFLHGFDHWLVSRVLAPCVGIGALRVPFGVALREQPPLPSLVDPEAFRRLLAFAETLGGPPLRDPVSRPLWGRGEDIPPILRPPIEELRLRLLDVVRTYLEDARGIFPHLRPSAAEEVLSQIPASVCF
jgi:hypothetical protein